MFVKIIRWLQQFPEWIKKPVNKLILIRASLFIFNMSLVLAAVIYVVLKLGGKV